MKTMTIRNIPDSVAAYISGKASAEGHSINSTAVAILSQAAGLTARPKKRRDLSWFSGLWTKSEKQRFDETVAECRNVDPEDWK